LRLKLEKFSKDFPDQKLAEISVKEIKNWLKSVEPGSVSVLFDDQSNMKIKTAGPATILEGGKVKFVHETKAEFKIYF
jgi:hypothetical protein